MRKMTIAVSLLALVAGAPALASDTLPLLGAGGKVSPTRGAGYVGPGDLISGAILYYGLRAYSAAKRGTAAINVCLPLDVTCGDMMTDATTGALVVSTLSGVACNNTVSICTIKIWYDQSGSLACTGAPCSITTALAANRATLVVPGAANGCSAVTLPCAAFTASSAVVSSAAVSSLTAPYTLSSIAVRTSGTSYSALLTFNGGNDGLYYGTGASKVNLFAGADHLANQADGSWHAVQALSNGASSSLNVDGVQTTFTATARNLSTLDGLGTDGAGDPLTGKISEEIAWATPISAGNITAMNSNQHTYWGF